MQAGGRSAEDHVLGYSAGVIWWHECPVLGQLLKACGESSPLSWLTPIIRHLKSYD